ncbi:MAG: hypothetical protein IT207_09020 [Fimbriimonadaceae bacterium]|nr:hypothetical protein [Fimbriimonadaceae bacterium]
MNRRFPRLEPAWIVVAVPLVGFLVSWLPGIGDAWRDALVSRPDRFAPHTWVTYSVAFPGFSVFELLGLVWLFFVVRMVASRVGDRRTYAMLLIGAALPAALSYALHAWVPAPVLFGTFVPSAMLTAYVAAKDPKAPVLLFGIVPLTMTWIAILAVAALVINYGSGSPLSGVVLASPAVAFWIYGSNRFPMPSGRRVQSGRGGMTKSPREFDEFLSKVREREQARKEEEALRSLLERPPADRPESEGDD